MAQRITTTQGGLKEVAYLAKLMDAQFRIPGTNIRFGLDGIIGLIPGVGDLSTFAVSGFLMWIMARNGASSYVLTRMALNVLIDTAIGSIPFIGDIFDVAFKANMRNLRLMQEHYLEGRHRGGAWKVIVPLLIVLLLVMACVIYAMYKLISSLF